MNVVELKKRRNLNPSLRDHEERLTAVEDFNNEIRDMFSGVKKRLAQWSVTIIMALAASGFIDGRAVAVIKAIVGAQ